LVTYSGPEAVPLFLGEKNLESCELRSLRGAAPCERVREPSAAQASTRGRGRPIRAMKTVPETLHRHGEGVDMSRRRGAKQKKPYPRRPSWGEAVDRANSDYERLHGRAKVVYTPKAFGYVGTQAPLPSRPEHKSTPPWIALVDDPPFPPPRQKLIALAQRCFPWEQSP
jgi:hypothetical protein